jgi:cytoskeletal protein CcmA (bactofilin family)
MTTIGPSLIITGEMTSQEDVTIHGRVKGQIHMNAGALLVAPTGTLDAEVKCAKVTVHGTLAGNVEASDRVELTPTANVTGNLTMPALVLQEGATFSGSIKMERGGAKRSKTTAAA